VGVPDKISAVAAGLACPFRTRTAWSVSSGCASSSSDTSSSPTRSQRWIAASLRAWVMSCSAVSSMPVKTTEAAPLRSDSALVAATLRRECSTMHQRDRARGGQVRASARARGTRSALGAPDRLT
jgi:hypothetical protein